jgi:hypothetical protein
MTGMMTFCSLSAVQDLDAVHFGHLVVQQNEVGVFFKRFLKPLLALLAVDTWYPAGFEV